LISVSVPGIYTDTQLEVDVRIQDATANRFVAITCREQQAPDGSTDKGYRFVVWPAAGNVVIERVDGGRSTTLAGPATASAMRAGNTENRVALTCAGRRVAGRINNTDVISVEDAAYREGSLLIGTGAGGEGAPTVEARFRDLVVYAAP
jgi:hypothetical protein